MVKRCMESRTPFGVINISAGRLATIGTIADIREATRYVDGRWDLVTLGTTRFRVIRLDRDAPYLRAEIALLDEPEGGPSSDLLSALNVSLPVLLATLTFSGALMSMITAMTMPMTRATPAKRTKRC